MKVIQNAVSQLQPTAASWEDVEEGKLYKTRNGSLVMKPSRAFGVPDGLYLRIIHFASPEQSLMIGVASRSRFPWTEVETGKSFTLVQE